MLASIDSRLFGEWMAYAEIEPFGPKIDDYRAGVVSVSLLNQNRAPNSEPVLPLQVFPWHSEIERTKHMTDEEHSRGLASALRSIAK